MIFNTLSRDSGIDRLPQYRLILIPFGLFWATPSFLSAGTEPDPAAPPIQITRKPPVILSEGEQRVFHYPKMSRFSLSGAAFRSRSAPKPWTSDALMIKAIEPGVGELWIWTPKKTIIQPLRSRAWRDDQGPQALLEGLSSLSEAEIHLLGSKAILRGEIRSIPELRKIEGIKALANGRIIDQTTLSTKLQKQGLERLTEISKKNHLSLEVRPLGQSISIEGTSRLDERTTLRLLTDIFPRFEVQFSSSDQARNVYFRVYLLEILKVSDLDIGVKWPNALRGTFRAIPGLSLSPLQLEASLHAMESKGSARIVSRPELVVQVPGKAELFSGDEFPIRTQGRFFSSVDWKAIGLGLTLHATKIEHSNVTLEIEVQSTQINADLESGEVPGMKKSRIKTTVKAQFSRPLLLSGLYQSRQNEQTKGLPLLSRIPLFGSLFGKQKKSRAESELVAIILPFSAPPYPHLASLQLDYIPKGPLPPPRNWIAPGDFERLVQDSSFPWNAL